MLRKLVLAAIIITVSGCSTFPVNRYSGSTDNETALKSIRGKALNVHAFTSSKPGLTEITCRGVGTIKTPDGQTFEGFLKKAFSDELEIAGLYSPTSPLTLTGNLDFIDFSSLSGNWNLALTVRSTNGTEISIVENYSYKTSFFGETACNRTAQALIPTVQNLIGKVVRHSKFHSLIN